MLRVLIADDHAIVRRGLKDILLEQFPFATITEISDTASLLEKVIKEEWDIIISDLSMPGRSSLDALPQIKQYAPRTPVLILSIYPEDQYAIRVLKAGGSGYLNKDMAPDELINAVHIVLNGRKYITNSIAEKLVDFTLSEKPLHELLSDREFEVLKLLATGKTLTEIGEAFHLSVNTISTYRLRILGKLNMKTNADLVQYSIAHRLI
ncbi:MAG TPA: response regulator transcription factor [Chitinophagaceae bacterium]|jgi:DNA-binding NarL/FixJ family response regulator|nr:response regulator transcription factor [Chitinophagaceae bacterium]